MTLKPGHIVHCCRVSEAPVFMTRRLRGCMEFIVVSLVWGVLMALAVQAYRVHIERAYVSEVLFHAITIKRELMTKYAVSGTWPEAADDSFIKDAEQGRRRVWIEYGEGGAFTFVMGRDGAPYRLSFRAAVSESALRAPVQWLCGYEEPPPGYRVIAKNQTDVPMLYLPNACQGRA